MSKTMVSNDEELIKGLIEKNEEIKLNSIKTIIKEKRKNNVSKIRSLPFYPEIEKYYLEKRGKLTISRIYEELNKKYKFKELNIHYSNFLSWTRTKVNQEVREEIRKRKDAEKKFCRVAPEKRYIDGENNPVWFVENILKMKLHQGQKLWLEETCREGRKKNVLVPGNQFGKTAITAMKHLWLCFYKKGLPAEVKEKAQYETLAISPQLRQVRAFYNYILLICQGLFWWENEEGKIEMNDGCLLTDFLVKPTEVPSTHQISQTPIEFANGAKIYAASTGSDMGGGLAGGQFVFISYDECPLSHNLEEELSGRIRSRLIKHNGTLDLIGTPDDLSESLPFYERMVDKGLKKEDGWYTQVGKLDDNIFIPQKNRDEFKESLKKDNYDRYRQVVFGEFVKGSTSIFNPQMVKKMWMNEWEKIKITEGAWQIFPPQFGHAYMIGVDWALSNDYTVFVVLDYTDEIWKIVYFYRIKGSDKPPQQQYIDLLELKEKYNADITMDSSGLGGKLIESEFKDIPGVEGFNFGPGRKAGFIGTLKKNLAWNGSCRIRTAYIPELEEELLTYKIDDRKITQDSVIALGLAVWSADKDEDLPTAVNYNF